MNDIAQKQGKNINVLRNDEFTAIFTMTGLRLLCNDPNIPCRLALPSDSVTVLGNIASAALAQSTIIMDPMGFKRLLESGIIQDRAKAWEADMCMQFGYKTKRALYQNMLSVSVRDAGGVLTFRPSRHDKLEHWKGVDESLNVVIPTDSSPDDIGNALNEAFRRCQ